MEAKELWRADYEQFKRQHDEAVALFRRYQQHAEANAHMFAVAAEVSRIDRSAAGFNSSSAEADQYFPNLSSTCVPTVEDTRLDWNNNE